MKAYFLQRMGAVIIDFLVIFALTILVSMIIPPTSKYEETLKESNGLLEQLKDNKITSEEYVNKNMYLSYTLDKESAINTIVSIFISLMYYGIFQFYNKGRTFGKKIMKIEVISTSKNKLTLDKMIIRTLLIEGLLANIICLQMLIFITQNQYLYTVFPISSLKSIFIIVSLFMIIFRKDGKGLHDIICKTQVVVSE